MAHTQYRHLPGGELVEAGLSDLAAGLQTAEALAVSAAAERLRGAGVEVPAGDASISRPQHQLYELLAQEDADSAHGRYNAVIRRLVSFARAAEHARAH